MVEMRWSQSFGGRLGTRQCDTWGDTIEDKPGAHSLSDYHIE